MTAAMAMTHWKNFPFTSVSKAQNILCRFVNLRFGIAKGLGIIYRQKGSDHMVFRGNKGGGGSVIAKLKSINVSNIKLAAN